MKRMVIYALVGIIAFFVVASLAAFLQYLYAAPKIVSEATPADFGLEYEEVSFRTTDNVTLQGWFIPHAQEQNAQTIVVLHGWPADKGNVLPIAAFLAEEYNLFLFDFRALGQSEGQYSTFGAKEQEDLKAALSHLESRGLERVGVWGFSMGGAVALMGAAKDDRIAAVVADSSYARLDWMMSEAFGIPLLRHPLAFATRLWGMAFLQIDAKSVSPVQAAGQLAIPVLLIHSEHDEVVPFSHALALQEALRQNSQAETWFPQTPIHGALDPTYQQRLGEFFRKTLQP